METIELTRSEVTKKLKAYFDDHDTSCVAEDAVYTNMATGEEIHGREGVSNFLHYFYHVAFDAKAIIKNLVITDTSALLEVDFIGTHIGEFAGIRATGREVNVPICVSYDLNSEGMIQKGRIYMITDILIGQLRAE